MESEEALESRPPENPFLFLVKSQSEVEKLRVAAQVRQTHLLLNGLKELVAENALSAEFAEEILEYWKKKRELLQTQVVANNVSRLRDTETDLLVEKLLALEEFVDDRAAMRTENHPAAVFFTGVKGVGKENIGKVIGFIDIRKADTVSALWKYAGFHTVLERMEKTPEGPLEIRKAPKRTPGQKLEYNSRLRSMCWRLGTSLLKGGGKFYAYYVQEKTEYLSRFKAKGVNVVPTAQLPEDEKGRKYEPEGVISEGHVHNMALRKMIKLFLSCLWAAWREAEGLAVRGPYVLEHFPEHTHLISWQEMMDRPAKAAKARKTRKEAAG